jgi:hypothetical protein
MVSIVTEHADHLMWPGTEKSSADHDKNKSSPQNERLAATLQKAGAQRRRATGILGALEGGNAVDCSLVRDCLDIALSYSKLHKLSIWYHDRGPASTYNRNLITSLNDVANARK